MEMRTLGQTRTQQTGDLLDEGLGSDEGIVLAGELLNELLVLVELLEVINAHGVNTAVLRTVDIVLVTQNADAHVGAGDGGQLDSAGETLVTLGVIVLQTDLEPWWLSVFVSRRFVRSRARGSYSTVSKKLRFLVLLLYSSRSATF